MFGILARCVFDLPLLYFQGLQEACHAGSESRAKTARAGAVALEGQGQLQIFGGEDTALLAARYYNSYPRLALAAVAPVLVFYIGVLVLGLGEVFASLLDLLEAC